MLCQIGSSWQSPAAEGGHSLALTRSPARSRLPEQPVALLTACVHACILAYALWRRLVFSWSIHSCIVHMPGYRYSSLSGGRGSGGCIHSNSSGGYRTLTAHGVTRLRVVLGSLTLLSYACWNACRGDGCGRGSCPGCWRWCCWWGPTVPSPSWVRVAWCTRKAPHPPRPHRGRRGRRGRPTPSARTSNSSKPKQAANRLRSCGLARVARS